MPAHDRFVVITGCSGGGKSTLLDALAAAGHATVPEPGRRIVRAETATGGTALPWIDMAAFARRALEMARDDHAAAARTPGWTVFDRSAIDAASALAQLEQRPLPDMLGPDLRYHRRVFVTPPWPELFSGDAERRHGLADAEAEYHRLCRDYPALGYELVELPRLVPAARVRFMLDALGSPPAEPMQGL